MRRLVSCTRMQLRHLTGKKVKKSIHVPVMPEQVLTALDPKPGQVIVDATFGGGGHSRRILEQAGHGVTLLALDADPSAVERAQALAADFPHHRILSAQSRLSVLADTVIGLLHQSSLNNQDVLRDQSNLKDPKVPGVVIDEAVAGALKGHGHLVDDVIMEEAVTGVLKDESVPNLGKDHFFPGSLKYVDAVLMDLGPSSDQLETENRGYSVVRDGPLDMRMDPSCSETLTAAEVVNGLSQEELGNLIRAYSDDTYAFRIAKAIRTVREEVGPILRTKELALVIETAVGFGARDSMGRKAHPATKTFQALRMFVNDELGEAYAGVWEAAQVLKPGSGQLAVITFHSGEDRVVKRALKGLAPDDPADATPSQPPLWGCLSLIQPSREELEENPRARSAKLRLAQRSS